MPVEYSQITTQMQTHVSRETFAKLWQNDEPPHTLEAVELFSNNNNIHTHIYMSIMYQGQLNDLNGILRMLKICFFFNPFICSLLAAKPPKWVMSSHLNCRTFLGFWEPSGGLNQHVIPFVFLKSFTRNREIGMFDYTFCSLLFFCSVDVDR